MSYFDMYSDACYAIRKSPSAVALEIGISKPTVTNWRQGGSPNASTKVKINDYFGYDIEQGIKKEPTADGGNEFSKVELELMECYRKVPPEVQVMLLKIARDYASSLE